ncbi:hypothetical protein D3C75_1053820 [compost metagenome]
MRIQGSRDSTNFQLVPQILPASQVATNWYLSGSRRKVSTIIAALIPAATATPVSSSRIGEIP